MRNLALSEEILLQIEKPERYIGNEVNSVMKDKNAVDIRFAFAFPDVYEIGMSHLGIQILYDMFNRREGIWCERVYSPWPDLDQIMREKEIPLFALESQDPIRSFDFLGMTLQYEMCYTNILQILELSRIPLRAKDRTGEDPIVIGGGPCIYNPEPIAEFFDLIYIGEGEVAYDRLFEACRKIKERTELDADGKRNEFLKKAACIPGIYVPSFYEPVYNPDHTLHAFIPLHEGLPSKIKRVAVTDFNQVSYPDAQVVPYLQATQDRVVLEVMRGCIRGCRFCQAGMVYRPTRQKSLETLKRDAAMLLANTGYDEISLSSLSTSDFTELDQLLEYLMEICPQKGVNISLPSLRIDAFSLDVMSKVQDVKKSSLTFAPEAGTQRMRDVINKGLTEEEILSGAREAFEGGWNKVKLYFMLGLPFETEEDAKGIAHLCQKVADEYYEIPKEQRNGKCNITASCSYFVPKPFTPFQWARMDRPEEFLEKARAAKDEVRAQVNQKSIRFTYHAAGVSQLEGVFARGDRKLSDVIEYAYQHGAIFDAWTERFKQEIWDEAFHACGIDPDFYTHRERECSELLPWDFIDVGVTRRFLETEWKRAKEGVITPNCREACSGCGAAAFGTGVCYES